MKKVSSVFWITLVIIALIVFSGIFYPQGFEHIFGNIMNYVVSLFGWYYLVFFFLVFLYPQWFDHISGNIMYFVASHLGWYYLVIVSLFILFCIYMIFGPFGTVRLGQPGDRPEFSYPTWFAMLFSAGMGIGLVFYG